MTYGFLDIAVTPEVRAVQSRMGSDRMWTSSRHDRANDALTEAEVAFIAARDSFYMASVSETGWPYVQHRGGPAGFLRVIDGKTLAFADYSGNRQYISAGNVSANDRVSLILMDYPRRARLKIYAHIEAVEIGADPELARLVIDPDAKGRPERIFRLRLDAFDWNCPRHITPRYTAAEIAPTLEALRDQIAALEAEIAELKKPANGK
jgi:predicted pyridoxine 5'-phosphate oxidase superfamily flavin-nucleotide-binding protein